MQQTSKSMRVKKIQLQRGKPDRRLFLCVKPNEGIKAKDCHVINFWGLTYMNWNNFQFFFTIYNKDMSTLKSGTKKKMNKKSDQFHKFCHAIATTNLTNTKSRSAIPTEFPSRNRTRWRKIVKKKQNWHYNTVSF